MEIHHFDNLGLSVFNSWILIIPGWFISIIISKIKTKEFKRATDISWYTKKDKIASFISLFIMVTFLVFSVFIPIQFNTIWFYLGFALIILGFTGHIVAKINFMNAELDKPIENGLYRISRNPMYISFSVVMFGMIIVSLSIIFLILLVISSITTHILIKGEEKYCIKTYGESFENYLKKVPRYFIFF